MNHETKVNMAAINKNKTESMECSYLKLALFYSVLAEQFEGSTKKNIQVELLDWLIKPSN